MELDFTGLEKLGRRSPQDELLEGGQGRSTPKQENPAEGLLGASEGIGKLQREADRRKAEKERNLEVYKTYQNNIKAAGQLQTEILKGVKGGESIYTLFLKAAKAISFMTSDSLFYSQLQEDITTIYGAGLLEPMPLQMELTAIQERLRRLKEAEIREPQNRNIQAAIKAHEQRAGEIQNLIKRNERESVTA
jgi:hypothetical protein